MATPESYDHDGVSVSLSAPAGPPSINALPPTPPLSASDPSDAQAQSTTNSRRDVHARGVATPSSSSNYSLPPAAGQPFEKSIMQHLRNPLSLPKVFVHEYSSFVTKNASSVSSIESALRSLTYLIPGRFRDAEIASESLHSSIQLLSLYHDTLLARAVAKLPGMPKIGTPHNRYTKYWVGKSKFYRRIALLLQCTQYTELLWEMAAKRRGEKIRWRVVILIEALKAICRLMLVRITGGRMVVPPLPEREPIPEAEDEDENEFGEPILKPPKDWTMPRTGLSLPPLPSTHDIGSFLMSHVLTADDIKPSTNLLSKITGTAQAAEVLHIIRPVIYAIAMSRVKDKKDWRPWVLGMAVELAARQLRSERIRTGQREAAMEKEEWNRRGWAMGWWALRGAFYENVTKGWVSSITNARFMPGLVGGIIEDYAFLWEEYHFASDDM